MRPVLAALVLLVTVCGCGPNAVGEPCANPGETTDCVEGARCTQDRGVAVTDPGDPSWSSYTCRTDCTTSASCPDGFDCLAVVGRETFRTCQPVATAP